MLNLLKCQNAQQIYSKPSMLTINHHLKLTKHHPKKPIHDSTTNEPIISSTKVQLQPLLRWISRDPIHREWTKLRMPWDCFFSNKVIPTPYSRDITPTFWGLDFPPLKIISQGRGDVGIFPPFFCVCVFRYLSETPFDVMSVFSSTKVKRQGTCSLTC